jgi:transcriptional regulator with XRE-family HTH domain
MASLLAEAVMTPCLARGVTQENPVRDIEEHTCPPPGRPDPWMVFCGQVIRERRDAAGLTLEALGREVGFKESHMSHIECGRAYPRLVKLFEILRVLGIRMSYPFVPEPPLELVRTMDLLLRADPKIQAAVHAILLATDQEGVAQPLQQDLSPHQCV